MVLPHSGLYFKLRKYNLPYPEAVFDGGYFRQVEFLAAKDLKGSYLLFMSKLRNNVGISVFSMLVLSPGPKTLLRADQVTFVIFQKRLMGFVNLHLGKYFLKLSPQQQHTSSSVCSIRRVS